MINWALLGIAIFLLIISVIENYQSIQRCEDYNNWVAWWNDNIARNSNPFYYPKP